MKKRRISGYNQRVGYSCQKFSNFKKSFLTLQFSDLHIGSAYHEEVKEH